MNEKFIEIAKNIKIELESVNSLQALNDLKVKYVGKNGEVTSLLRGMKDIPAEERSAFGKMVNDLKEEVTSYFDEKEKS